MNTVPTSAHQRWPPHILPFDILHLHLLSCAGFVSLDKFQVGRSPCLIHPCIPVVPSAILCPPRRLSKYLLREGVGDWIRTRCVWLRKIPSRTWVHLPHSYAGLAPFLLQGFQPRLSWSLSFENDPSERHHLKSSEVTLYEKERLLFLRIFFFFKNFYFCAVQRGPKSWHLKASPFPYIPDLPEFLLLSFILEDINKHWDWPEPWPSGWWRPTGVKF